jgi:hypothetical protein
LETSLKGTILLKNLRRIEPHGSASEGFFIGGLMGRWDEDDSEMPFWAKVAMVGLFLIVIIVIILIMFQ